MGSFASSCKLYSATGISPGYSGFTHNRPKNRAHAEFFLGCGGEHRSCSDLCFSFLDLSESLFDIPVQVVRTKSPGEIAACASPGEDRHSEFSSRAID